MVPDPSTFRVLPWAPHTGWMLCDLQLADGRPMPLDTRAVCRKALEEARRAATSSSPAWKSSSTSFKHRQSRACGPATPASPGSRRSVGCSPGLPVPDRAALRRDRSGPGDPAQATSESSACRCARSRSSSGRASSSSPSAPRTGLPPADAMVLFRSAVKQIARRHGYHATFMCRPKLPNVMSSGWHLHQSLTRQSGRQRLHRRARAAVGSSASSTWRACSPMRAAPRPSARRPQRLQALPALLARARPRDLGPATIAAPWCACWARPGEPATRTREPRRRAGGQSLPLYGEPDRERPRRHGDASSIPARRPTRPTRPRPTLLPRSLDEALAALRDDKVLRAGFGDFFVDYYLQLKQAEIDRFNLEVSEWEQREYFDLF